MGCTWQTVTEFAATLPGIVEGTSYGTPALRVAKTFLTRFRPEDDSIVIKMPIDERDMQCKAAPDVYFLTDHYRSYPTVLVRLAGASSAELEAVLLRAWREAAPKNLLAAFNGEPTATKASKPAARRAPKARRGAA